MRLSLSASILTRQNGHTDFAQKLFDTALPAPETLQEAMSQRFEPITNPQGLAWGGVALQQQQWLGDKGEQPEKKSQATKQKPKADEPQQLTFQA